MFQAQLRQADAICSACDRIAMADSAFRVVIPSSPGPSDQAALRPPFRSMFAQRRNGASRLMPNHSRSPRATSTVSVGVAEVGGSRRVRNVRREHEVRTAHGVATMWPAKSSGAPSPIFAVMPRAGIRMWDSAACQGWRVGNRGPAVPSGVAKSRRPSGAAT